MAAAPQDLQADRDAVISFLRESVQEQVHLVAITPDGPISPRWFGDEIEAAADWACHENMRGRGLYWTVNFVEPEFHGKPTKDNILFGRFLHVDVDPPKDGGPWDRDAVLIQMEAMRVPPSFVIDSGGGIGGFWRLSEMMQQRDAVERMNIALSQQFGGDHCHNIDRLMRLPGTVNWPNRKKISAGRQPALARLVVEDDGVSYPTHVLTLEFRPEEKTAGDRAQVASADGYELLTADDLGLLTLSTVRAAIEHPPGRDRSGDALAAARLMANAGFSDNQIFGVLLNPANAVSRCILEKRDPFREVVRCLEVVRAPNERPMASGAIDANAAGPSTTTDGDIPITALPYVWIDPADIPMRPWVFGRWLLRGTVTALIAPGGIGKTTFLCSTALSLATALPLLRKQVWEGPKRIWIWNLEDPLQELQRSIQAAAKMFGIRRDQIEGRLFVNTSMDGSPLCTAIEDANGFKLLSPVYEKITRELIDRQIDVLVIDPFVSSHAVEENANSLIDKIAKAWGRVANDANCCVILIHHTSKAGAAEVTTLSARGAKALTDACRATLVLNRMDAEVADGFGFDDQERRRYFSVQDDKHNRAPAENAEWYRLASVDLGNGGLDGSAPGDSIGVSVPWEAPDPFANVRVDHRDRVFERIGEGGWRQDSQANAWAGNVVAEVLGLDLGGADAKKIKTRIKAMLRTWISNGVLRVADQKDPVSRKMVKFIVQGALPNEGAQPDQGGAEQGGAVERPACSTTTPSFKGGWSGAARSDGGMVAQEEGGAADPPPFGNPALQRGPVFPAYRTDDRNPHGERLAPGEDPNDPDDPINQWR